MANSASSSALNPAEQVWSTVRVDFEAGVAWVTLNRPEKRNCMNPTLNAEMHEVLDFLEADDRCGVLVLTGAGESFCAGMDLKEYFRETEAKGHIAIRRAQRSSYGWFRRLRWFEKPTIAMVNGWCFGGAFGPVFSCDLAVAAETATFGVSEINWGIIPGGNVTKVLVELMSARDAMYYTLTGETFDGKKAAAMRVVNEAVPLDQLRTRVRAIARLPAGKEPGDAQGGQGRGQARVRDDRRRVRGLSGGAPGGPELPGQVRRPQAGHQAVHRRQEFPAGPGAYKKTD